MIDAMSSCTQSGMQLGVTEVIERHLHAQELSTPTLGLQPGNSVSRAGGELGISARVIATRKCWVQSVD